MTDGSEPKKVNEMRNQCSAIYRGSWSVENPYDIKVERVERNTSPERVGPREIEVFDFSEAAARTKVENRRAQYRRNPARWDR